MVLHCHDGVAAGLQSFKCASLRPGTTFKCSCLLIIFLRFIPKRSLLFCSTCWPRLRWNQAGIHHTSRPSRKWCIFLNFLFYFDLQTLLHRLCPSAVLPEISLVSSPYKQFTIFFSSYSPSCNRTRFLILMSCDTCVDVWTLAQSMLNGRKILYTLG